MKKAVLSLMLAGTLLGGCASNQYCLKPQKYQSARSIPPLRGTSTLQMPVSAGALLVPPPVGAQRVPFGQKIKGGSGKTQVVCLDQPPVMPRQIQGNEVGQ